jgi:large subunit ribosomal protein L22
MQATARLKYLMMSPRKVRRVIELIKGKPLDEALTILKFTNRAAAVPLLKTIQSAAANALAEEGTSRLKAEDLVIKRIYVDEGPRAKRIRFRAMGRVYRYKKRFSHLTVVVEGEPREEAPSKKRRVKKRAKAASAPVKTKKTARKKEDDVKTTPAKKKMTKKTGKAKPTAKKTTAAKSTSGKATAKKAATRKAAAKKKTSKKSDTAKKDKK